MWNWNGRLLEDCEMKIHWLTILLIVGTPLVVFLFVLAWVVRGNQVDALVIGAGEHHGESFLYCQALAEVAGRHLKQGRLEVRETDGSRENMLLLEKGEVQLAVAQADVELAPGARLICMLFPDYFQLVVGAQSGIDSIRDLEGKRVAVQSFRGGQYHSLRFLLEHFGLKHSDLILVQANPDEANAMLREGKVDAVFRVRAPRNETIADLLNDGTGRLLPIEQTAALLMKQPALTRGILPTGSYQGYPPQPDRPLNTLAVPRLLLAHRDLSDEVVKELTALIFERRQELANETPLANLTQKPSEMEWSLLPVHPGAQSFYDGQRPSFLHENAEVIALILSIFLMIASWIWQMRRQMADGRKNRADRFNRKIMKLCLQAESCQSFDELREIRHELLLLLDVVVAELDQDKISETSFHSFSFTWEAAIASIRHRERLILDHLVTPNPSASAAE